MNIPITNAPLGKPIRRTTEPAPLEVPEVWPESVPEPQPVKVPEKVPG